VYLFHELPPEVRRVAAAEMARVLRPGGLLVVTDSIQLGDRERLDANLARFGDFNEPYYASYISEDFGESFPQLSYDLIVV
jgi:SAM-dependent methyltransferase